jgi:hypothetical protein
MTGVSNSVARWRAVALAAALLVLDGSLSFSNIWPTPAVRWQGELSVELAVCLFVMAVIGHRHGPPSRAVMRGVAALWVLLVIGRYADVTAPALYGRGINPYWDLRHVSAVAAMLARAASSWLVFLVICAAVLIPLVLYAVLRWALGCVSDSMRGTRERRTLGWLAGLAVVLFAGQRLSDRVPGVPTFTTPVTQTYARQARLLVRELTASRDRTLGPGPSFDADLARVKGADVFLFFIESYGAVSYDRPEFVERLAASRAQLEADILSTGRDVVSAFVESPTFGGNSWLAHISLLTGIEVRDEDTNVLLMAQKRDTLATAFARRGYRTVAIMPGLQSSWPEGVFYGFGDIYSAERLDYRGPPIGWWTIPDQFAMARMDAMEVAPVSRAPLFAFFPTTGTHTPFRPTAPYQPDWARMLTDRPYDDAVVDRLWAQQPDWLNLGPSYVQALSATYVSLGGYLRLRADRDFVMILIGDHQPPAAVSGVGARWDVPVHVIASRTQVLEPLLAHGFLGGLTPRSPAVARMHELLPLLLDAFGGRERTTARAGTTPALRFTERLH